MEAAGTHCLCELFECPGELLNDPAHIEESLRGAVRCGDATLLREVSFKFHPQGVTALALISESHVSIHTWPECGYAAVDAFTCGTQANAGRAIEHLVEALGAGRYLMRTFDRGLHLADGAGVRCAGGEAVGR